MTRPNEPPLPAPVSDASPAVCYPPHVGVLLAVNAIRDAQLVVDGPDCVLRKAEYVYGRHDLLSTLLDAGGHHRVTTTDVNAESVVFYQGAELIREVRKAGADRRTAAVLVATMPHVALVGVPHASLLQDVRPSVPKPVLEVRTAGHPDDWLGGYAAVLDALAAELPLVAGPRDPTRVALVGHLLDRNEADQTANVAELRRLLRGLGLRADSVWLAGEPVAALQQAGRAATIVALPAGVHAAHALAARTGATVVACPTPFGLRGSEEFLRTVAGATGRERRAERLIARELRHCLPRVERLVVPVLCGRRLAFAGPPDLFRGFMEMSDELGMRVLLLASSALPVHLRGPLPVSQAGVEPLVLCAPSTATLQDPVLRRLSTALDLFVGSCDFAGLLARSATAWVPLGFPNYHDHALHPRPALGFRGWLCQIERWANGLFRARCDSVTRQ